MRLPRSLSVLVLVLGLTAACENDRLRPDSPSGPTPPEPPLVATQIEYRVASPIRNLDVTYSNAVQGTTFLLTDAPWFIRFDTLRPRTFVYLEVRAPFTNTVEGPLVGQIFVNGELFREATARGFFPVVTVSGEVTR